MFGIFNVCADVDACDYTQGLYKHRKRVDTESRLWEKNPLLHQGIRPAAVFGDFVRILLCHVMKYVGHEYRSGCFSVVCIADLTAVQSPVLPVPESSVYQPGAISI